MTAKRSSLHIADVELSVSRINRLLRPLRNKCVVLASATSRPSGSTAPITYASSSLSLLEARAPTPLDVLHDPKHIISRTHQESRSLDAQARQIYAVTNAYRNVVQAALPEAHDGSRRALLPLTDVCAASVGRSIKGEVTRCLATIEGGPDETQETALIDELYESVPVRFRSWTLIAHATCEIVDTCPNHPMLMLSLLGVALIHGLHAESKIFLRLFLTALMRSPRHGIPPPITHPMYPSYLVELCNEWTCLVPKPCASLFTRQSFATVTLDVLREHGSAAVWTCKSITRLVQLLRMRDFDCFLAFLRGLIENLAAQPTHFIHGRKENDSVLARLAKWTGVITTDFFSVGDGDGERARTHPHQFYSIVEILASAYDAGLHRRAIDDHYSYDDMDVRVRVRDPRAALVCAATQCLAVSHTSTTTSISPHHRAVLELLHAADAPRPAIFNVLAHLPLAHLHALAGALRAHDLGALECALWASAVEHSSTSRPGRGAEPALRAALADAERWGQEVEDMHVDAAGGGTRVCKPSSTRSRSRSPPRKRARRETAPRRMSQQRLSSLSPSLPSSSSSSASVASTPPLSSASSARSPSGSPAPGKIVGASEDDDDDTARGSRLAVRSCADLKSVLADALRTCKDLKAERRRASLRAGCCGSHSALSRRTYGRERNAAASTLPSEGDVLDMFAYDDPF